MKEKIEDLFVEILENLQSGESKSFFMNVSYLLIAKEDVAFLRNKPVQDRSTLEKMLLEHLGDNHSLNSKKHYCIRSIRLTNGEEYYIVTTSGVAECIINIFLCFLVQGCYIKEDTVSFALSDIPDRYGVRFDLSLAPA